METTTSQAIEFPCPGIKQSVFIGVALDSFKDSILSSPNSVEVALRISR